MFSLPNALTRRAAVTQSAQTSYDVHIGCGIGESWGIVLMQKCLQKHLQGRHQHCYLKYEWIRRGKLSVTSLSSENTVWLVILVRDLFLHSSWVKSHMQNPRTRWTNHVSICPAWKYLAANRSVSVSVPFTLKPSTKFKCSISIAKEPDSGTRPRAKAIVSMNVPGVMLLSSPDWNKELRLPSLSVNKSRHLLSF